MADVRLWIFQACDVMDRQGRLFRGLRGFFDPRTTHGRNISLTVTKPFCDFDANVLKPQSCTGRPQRSAETAAGRQTDDQRQGTTMFNLDALTRNSRRAAVSALRWGRPVQD